MFAWLSFSRASHCSVGARGAGRPSPGNVHVRGGLAGKPPSPPLPARCVSVGRLFKEVINAHEQGQFRGEASSINWSSTNPEANRADTDQEPEKNQSPPPCKARALCEQEGPGGFRVPKPPWHVASAAPLAGRRSLWFPFTDCSAEGRVPVPPVSPGRHLTPLSLRVPICSVGMVMCTYPHRLWEG